MSVRFPCHFFSYRLDSENKENLYADNVCEVAAKKRKKDYVNNNTKSQCK